MDRVQKFLINLVTFCILIGSSLSSPCPCQDPSLCKPIQTGERKEIVAFQVDANNWKHYNFSIITTVALFTNLNSEMLCAAHQNGVRVVWGVSYPYEQLGNSTQRSTWIKQMISQVQNTFTDGVNVDIEYPITQESPEVQELDLLMKELKTAFSQQIPGSQVTFDVAWSPNCIDGRCYDSFGLSQYTDFLVIMSYDLRSQIFGPCIASANSPVPLVKEGIDNFTKLGISQDKLVLGLPWYGYDYTCINPTNETVCPIQHIPFRGVNCSDAAGVQKDIRTLRYLLVDNSTNGYQWDSSLESPWFNYIDQNTGAHHQVWFDDVRSLTIKYELAKKMNLRGLAFWNIDCLDYGSTHHAKVETREMWEAILKFF